MSSDPLDEILRDFDAEPAVDDRPPNDRPLRRAIARVPVPWRIATAALAMVITAVIAAGGDRPQPTPEPTSRAPERLTTTANPAVVPVAAPPRRRKTHTPSTPTSRPQQHTAPMPSPVVSSPPPLMSASAPVASSGAPAAVEAEFGVPPSDLP